VFCSCDDTEAKLAGEIQLLQCWQLKTYSLLFYIIIILYTTTYSNKNNCYKVALAASDITGATDKKSDSNRSFNIGGNRVVY